VKDDGVCTKVVFAKLLHKTSNIFEMKPKSLQSIYL